jgi:arabinose-5-phosphate isomerase
MLNSNEICNFGRQAILDEIQALQELCDRMDEKFVTVCELLLACKGHVIVTGVGKSGHIANKIAATFASTGTPAFFIHPSEANHGDFGAITKNDVVLAISNSGTAEEIISLLSAINYLNIPLIAFTGNPDSAIAKAAKVNINIGVEKEACPLGLAPTSSTTAALVMGDAMAVALLNMRGFTANDFAFNHPGGNLGKRLLLKASDLMHKDIPKVTVKADLREALLEMTAKRLGMTTVVDENGGLLGIFTDGDLRRAFDQNLNINEAVISEIMVQNCKTITPEHLAIDALQVMESHNITSLPVTDEKRKVLGVIHIHDILKSGILPLKVS